MNDVGSFDVCFSVLIVAVLLLVFEERQHRRIAFTVGLAAFVCIWLGHGARGAVGRVFLIGACLLAAGFFGFALYGILRAILVKRVSGDAIFGAVCGYLLLGTIWTGLYAAVETASTGSFLGPTRSHASSPAASNAPADLSTLTYFSFVTLSTVGYGDVTPATPLARTLAWLEAITGQFYLAVLVAGLVGFRASQGVKD